MEEIIAKSLSANNEERKQATRHICEIMKIPAAFQEFWTVVVNSSNPDARQAAAMYFYKMVQKKKKWNHLPNEVRQRIKDSALERIHQEPEKKVKTVIVQAAGQIALNEPDGWPELFGLIEETISFEGMTEMRELGMFVISILTEHATSLFELHVTALMNVFGSVLTKPEYYGSPLAYLTVISMKNFLLCFTTKDKTVAQNFEYLIPSVLEVIKAQSTRNRPDRSIECLAFFEALLEGYPRVVSTNLKFIIEGLLKTAIFLNVDEISCKILDVISSIICQKTKKIAKDDEILQMLCQTLYQIISSPNSVEEGSDHYDVFDCDSNVVNGAVDLLDTLADEIDPDILMKHMMPVLDGAATSDNVFCKKAVYIILGVLIEKCRNQIKNAGLNVIIGFIREGLRSDCYLSLNGALFTLGRFIEHFKPEINIYLPELVPLLLSLLQNMEVNVTRIEAHLIPKIFCMLNECCEILESSLEPVLPIMVPTLLGVVNSSVKVHYRELAINVIGQAGAATKRSFREYFPMVLEVLRPFLADNLPDEQLPLQVQTFDTLGTLFKSLYVKGDEFQLVDDVVNVTLTITELKNCGELRSGLYSMLSDCSEFMKEKMENYIPRVLKLMDISFKEIDSYNAERSAEEIAAHGMSLDVESDRKSAPIKDLKIIEEKEEALMALGNIAFNTGAPFQPYLKQCYILCCALSLHENNVIRAAAMEALANLYISIKRCFPDDNSTEIPNEYLNLIWKFSNVVKLDDNVDVVYAVLEGYQKILKHIPQVANVVIEEGVNSGRTTINGAIIGSAVKIVITEKCHCQKLKMREDESDEEEDDEEDENDEEEDEIEDNYTVEDLIIAAEELIPLLGDSLPVDTFLVYFSSYQRHLLKLLEKHQVNEIRESTSATLGLCAKYLGSYMNVFAIEFAPIIATLMKDANDNVRNNVAFCIAQMVIHGKEAVFSYFNDFATSLLNWLRTENCLMVIDNICAAIASLITVNKDMLPLAEMLPLYFDFLPLREDFDENTIVFRSFNTLFQSDKYKEYLVKAVEVVLTSSIKKQVVSDEAKHEAVRLFELISKCYPNDKEFILRNLPEELKPHFVASL